MREHNRAISTAQVNVHRKFSIGNPRTQGIQDLPRKPIPAKKFDSEIRVQIKQHIQDLRLQRKKKIEAFMSSSPTREIEQSDERDAKPRPLIMKNELPKHDQFYRSFGAPLNISSLRTASSPQRNDQFPSPRDK